VSELAHGGQVLLEGSTFQGIRDRLTELGTVDARGYNDKLWRAAAKAALRQHTTGLLGLCRWAVTSWRDLRAFASVSLTPSAG
jgi:hypothetical protein